MNGGKLFAGNAQNNPVMIPSSVRSTLFAAGSVGSPGIVIMSPSMGTTNPAPDDTEIDFT